MSERLISQSVLSPPTVTHAPEIHTDKYQVTLPWGCLSDGLFMLT